MCCVCRVDKEAAANYVKRAQTYDGGIGLGRVELLVSNICKINDRILQLFFSNDRSRMW